MQNRRKYYAEGILIMLERGRISCLQTVFLLTNLVGATSVIFLPGITAQAAGRDAWMTPLVAILPGLYLAAVLSALGKRFPGKTLVQYLQAAFGAWLGKAVGLLYLFFFLHTNGFIIREFGELLVALLMPRTPLIVFHVFMLLLCAWAIRGGIEVIARVTELTFPWIILFFMVVLIMSAPNMEFENIFPLLEKGFLLVIKASLDPIGWRGEIILLGMFLPYIAGSGSGRCAMVAVILIGLILAFDSIINTAVFGPTVARLTFPTFSLVRLVNVGNLIERIESVLVAIWVLGLFSKIALFYYATVLGAAQLANLKDYRPLVLPVGVILAVLSLQVAGSSMEVVNYIVKGFPPFAYVFEYIIPTAVLGVAAARGIKGDGGSGRGGEKNKNKEGKGF
ncbi:MAG: GerAB/ArcD/ProY family transporter [Desulfocucumaceae bacterium]